MMLSSLLSASPSIPTAAAERTPPGRRISPSLPDPGDTFERSAFANMFNQLGLDSGSRLEATHDRIDFTFSFTSSTKEALSASGYVSQREQHAGLTLNYTFQRAVVVDGKRELRSFNASIAFEADTSQSLSVKPFKNKEDILHFLSRLMDDVVTLLQDDTQVLTGISLDQEDMAELMNLDKGKMKKLFDGMIAAIMTMAFLKRMKRGADAGPNVILTEERKAVQGIEVEKESAKKFSFSISITELEAKQETAAQDTAA